MNDLKRYSLELVGPLYGKYEEMQEDCTFGAWVRFDEANERIKELEDNIDSLVFVLKEHEAGHPVTSILEEIIGTTTKKVEVTDV